jgi:hypothetical protein
MVLEPLEVRKGYHLKESSRKNANDIGVDTLFIHLRKKVLFLCFVVIA